MSTAVFGAPEFRARSGRTVKVHENGTLVFDHVNGYLGVESVMDAEEFFQAQKDRECGRWRYPVEPDFVVYPGHAQGGGGDGSFRVLQESTGNTWSYRRDAIEGLEHVAWAAARAYFEAHPAKVWNDGVYVAEGLDPEMARLYKHRDGEWRDADGYQIVNFDPGLNGRRLIRLVAEDAS